MKKVKGPKQHTPEWYALRTYDADRQDGPVVTIGASEAAGACNLSEWTTPLELFRIKRRYQEDGPSRMQMRLGQALEPVVLDFAEELLPEVFPELNDGIRIRRNIPMYWLEEHPVVSASPDGMISRRKQPVEAKTTFNPRMAAKWGGESTDEIPADHIMQGQQQMLVMDAEVCYFPVLMLGMIRCFKVERDPTLTDVILEAEGELGERIINDDPPEPNWEHPRTPALIRSLNGVTEGFEVELSTDAQESVMLWKTLNAQIKELEKKAEAAQAKFLYEMEEAQIGKAPELGVEVVRHAYGEKLWTDEDLEEIREKIGKVKKSAFTRTTTRKMRRIRR